MSTVFVPAAQAATTPSQPLFGLVDGRLIGASPTQAAAILDQDASIGVTAVREQLSWNAAEPQPGVYNWGPFDQIVREVAAHHMSLLVLIDFTPPWARTAGCYTWNCAPANPAQFASFAAQAARRYGPWVKAWEIWNEPNNAGFWQPKPNPVTYSHLLNLTSAAIRSADPAAYIVSGGLAPEPDNNTQISPVRFLSDVCAAGGLSAPNAIGMHPYSSPVMPNYPAPWNAWQQMADTSVSLRSVESTCGVADKPIWITEYGAPTNGPGAGATLANLNLFASPDHVSEQEQAAMISQAVGDVKSYGWVGAFFVYSAADAGFLPTTNQNFYGLRTYYNQPKPAWGAYQAAIASGA